MAKLRLERNPPFRLQLIEGGKVSHELPLKNLGIIDALKMLLDYDDFHSDQDAGGIYNGTDHAWVQWSDDDEDFPKDLPVFRA